MVSIYYLIIQLISSIEKEADQNKYAELINLVIDNTSSFELHELADIYTLIRNYCIKQLNQGNKNFIQELFSLYSMELNQGTLAINNEMSPLTYKNIVALGLQIKKYQWTADFIENFKSFLPEDQRKDIYVYNIARLNFSTEKYREVIRLLHEVHFKELYLQLDYFSMYSTYRKWCAFNFC